MSVLHCTEYVNAAALQNHVANANRSHDLQAMLSYLRCYSASAEHLAEQTPDR